MQDTQEFTSSLLTQLLSASYPRAELGARLKQHLNSIFLEKGLGKFDEKSLGFSKFSLYLSKVHNDIVTIERNGDGGDILVSLRTPSKLHIIPNVQSPSATPVIRSAIWQAFTNTDIDRKRFFEKNTGEIVHYLDGSISLDKEKIEANPQNFVEVPFISKDVQMTWMSDFLESIQLPVNMKEALIRLIDEQYSSSINAAFTRALGTHSNAWRNYRKLRVNKIIEDWAKSANLQLEMLFVQTHTMSQSIQKEVAGDEKIESPKKVKPINSEQLSPRLQVDKLLDLLTDDDLSRLVLPILLSTLMIKSRL